MKFGVNENVNYVKPAQQEETDSPPPLRTRVADNGETLRQNKARGSSDSGPPLKVFSEIDGTTYLLGSMVTIVFLITRYVI